MPKISGPPIRTDIDRPDAQAPRQPQGMTPFNPESRQNWLLQFMRNRPAGAPTQPTRQPAVRQQGHIRPPVAFDMVPGYEGMSQHIPEYVQESVRKTVLGTGETQGQLGYMPAYWEDPRRVARAYQQLQALPPGTQPPEWMDPDRIRTAYEWFKWRNEDKPWTEWKFLPQDDPMRSTLQDMTGPPLEALGPNEMDYANPDEIAGRLQGMKNFDWYTLPVETRKKVLNSGGFDLARYAPAIQQQMLSDPGYDWSRVPKWQKWTHDALSSPWVMALPMGLAGAMAGVPAGPFGMAAGATVGYGIGLVGSRDYDPYKGILQQRTDAAKAMRALNILSEGTERALGVLNQTVLSARHPEYYGPLSEIYGSQEDFKAAWEAGSFFYEPTLARSTSTVLQMAGAWEIIPRLEKLLLQGKTEEAAHEAAVWLNEKGQLPGPGQDILLGRAAPVDLYPTLHTGKPGDADRQAFATDAGKFLTDARRRIRAGENPLDIMGELQGYAGSTISDFVAQSIADPLNVSHKVSGAVIERGAAATGMKALSAAAKAAGDAGRPGVWETWARYRADVHSGRVKVNELASFERTLAGVTAEGKIKALEPGSGRTGARGWFERMANLEPESKARLGLAMQQDNLGMFFSMFDNPDDGVRYFKALQNGDMDTVRALGAEFLDAPEMYTILPSLKNYNIDDMLKVWHATDQNRTVLLRVADILGEEPAKVLDSLARQQDARLTIERIAEKARSVDSPEAKALLADIEGGRLGADDLAALVRVYQEGGAPWHPSQWRAMVVDQLGTHFGDWAKAFWGLEPNSTFFRAAHVLKSAQSLLLLAANPGYLVNNLVNNMATRAAVGNFGYLTNRQITTYMDRFGVEPYRTRSGVGAAMAEEMIAPGKGKKKQARTGERILMEATQGKRGVLSMTDRLLRNTTNKIGLFSILSRKVEQLESANAFAIGMRQAWGGLWERGRGFRRMPADLTRALKGIDPRYVDLVYRAVEGGMNMNEVRGALQGRQTGMAARGLVRGAAERLGISPTQAAQMLDQIGVLDDLDGRMRNANTPAKVQAAFQGAERKAQDWIDHAIGRQYAAEAEHVANRVRTEGPHALVDIITKPEEIYTDLWIEHYEQWGETLGKLDDVPEEMRHSLVQERRRQSVLEWDRGNGQRLTLYKGLMDGMGMDHPQARQLLAYISASDEIWNTAYRTQIQEIDAFHNKYKTDWDNPARRADHAELNARLDKLFNDAFRDAQRKQLGVAEHLEMIFAEKFGEEAGRLARMEYEKTIQFRDEMWKRMQDHRRRVAGLPYDERRAAWQKFKNDVYTPMIVEMLKIKQEGAEKVFRAATGGEAPAVEGRPQTPPPAAPGGETGAVPMETGAAGEAGSAPLTPEAWDRMTMEPLPEMELLQATGATAMEKAEIARLALEAGIIGVDESGAPRPGYKLDVVRYVDKWSRPFRIAESLRFDDISLEMMQSAVRNHLGHEAARVQVDVNIAPLLESETGAAMMAVDPRAARQMAVLETVQSRPLADQPLPLRDALERGLRGMGEESAVSRKSLLQFIRDKGGIDLQLLRDVTGEEKVQRKWGPGVFRRGGLALDELVIRLVEDGYIRQADIDSPTDNGAINRVTAMIRDEIGGQKHYSMFEEGGATPEWYQALKLGKDKRKAVQAVISRILAGEENAAHGLEPLATERAVKGEAFHRLAEEAAVDPELARLTGYEFDMRRWRGDLEDLTHRATQVLTLEEAGMLRAELDAWLGRMPEEGLDLLQRGGDLAEQLNDLIDDGRMRQYADRAEQTIQRGAAHSEAIMTRELFREQLMETFGLKPEEADAVVEITDARAQAWEQVSGKNADQWYSEKLAEVVRGGEGDLQQFGESQIGRATMTMEEMRNYAQALVRAGAEELRRAVEGERDIDSRIALLDAAHQLNPEMAEQVAARTRKLLFQESKGAVSFLEDGRAIIHAFDGRDVSTAIHEVAHIFRRDLLPDDLKTVEDWAGVKKGKWTTAAEEKFARGFERYLAEGQAPTPKLAAVFAKFRAWLTEIYRAITGSAIDVPLTDEVRAVFDRMLGEAPLPPEGGIPPSATQIGGDVPVGARSATPADGLPGQRPTLFQDADPRFPPGGYEEASGYLPEAWAMDEGWRDRVRPLLEGMQDEALKQLGERGTDLPGMDAETSKTLNRYLNQVQGDMATSKLAAVRYAEMKRDSALLNYNKRYGFDKYLDVVAPYQFWYGRSFINWAMRFPDRAGWFSMYSRIRMQQDKYQRNLPERLRGKLSIPAPYLPEWMGGTLYQDPLRQMFPFANFLTPFETLARDQVTQVQEAERVLQEWAYEGSVDASAVSEAMRTRGGPVWEKALAEAKIRRKAEIGNPLDFVSMMIGPAWYLTVPAKLLGMKIPYINPQGDGPETISELPLTRTARAYSTALKGSPLEGVGNMIGWLAKPEEWMRQAAGMPEYGEYGDYYVDRQLANMAADGEISVEQAQKAMIERNGQAFELARRRVEQELMLRVPGANTIYAATHGENLLDGLMDAAQALPASFFGSGILPSGELEYRNLKGDWNRAWDLRDQGDTEAVTRFFEEHPEYEAYLTKNKKPEERMRSFLVGQIWDRYMALGETDRKYARAQMGELFQRAFLDKNTRSYESIDVQTLTFWARALGGEPPATEETQPAIQQADLQGGIASFPPEVSAVMDEYYRTRNEKFPGWYAVQQGFYSLPQSERTAYLLRFPELRRYWDWKSDYQEKHPGLDNWFNGDVYKRMDTSAWPPALLELVQYYALSGERLPKGALALLEQMWVAQGRPYGSVKAWLDSEVAPSVRNEMSGMYR